MYFLMVEIFCLWANPHKAKAKLPLMMALDVAVDLVLTLIAQPAHGETDMVGAIEPHNVALLDAVNVAIDKRT